jgi:L-aminopeptidase/D-esterase-like protein
MIGGKPAARMGDQCAHGGAIVLGCPTVLIGEVSPAVVNPLVMDILDGIDPAILKIIAQILAMIEAAMNGLPLIEPC